jgi:hypothetical protein
MPYTCPLLRQVYGICHFCDDVTGSGALRTPDESAANLVYVTAYSSGVNKEETRYSWKSPILNTYNSHYGVTGADAPTVG